MQFSAVILALAFGTAAAFQPFAKAPATKAPLKAATTGGSPDSLNGWVPDENAFAWGLPGALEPMGNFDPAGFADGCSLNEMKRYREAE
eukprot:CAMPEP_0182534542 /NCGR_PEP_ID=MMETSP1323-20130603/15966_1 /TAXON_ID=236787 /ORGANISM="Florenciella parvula, Strain RCC1693" /LENGTH=88 /DNA_ID=CAMNT_0024744569 /DNA_START=56 /DNA_END=319 /DNA_ORIENTATION=+